MKLYQDWLLSLSKNFRFWRISNFLTSKIHLYHQTLEQTMRSQSSESKWFRLPIKIAKLDPIISHLNFLNKPSKHQIGLTLSCLITVFIRILSKTGFRIFFRLKTGWNFSEGASTLEQTAAHAYTLHFSEILIMRAERA